MLFVPFTVNTRLMLVYDQEKVENMVLIICACIEL